MTEYFYVVLRTAQWEENSNFPAELFADYQRARDHARAIAAAYGDEVFCDEEYELKDRGDEPKFAIDFVVADRAQNYCGHVEVRTARVVPT